MVFLIVGKVNDVPVRKMRHVEGNGKEILIANVDGKFYAISDKCGHMNARLSMGSLEKNIVTCPLHSSRFDVLTGKVVSGPAEMAVGGNMFEKCPEEVQKTIMRMVQRQRELQSVIRTYDQPTYLVRVDGNDILVNV